MERSDRLLRNLAFACPLLTIALVSSCAQVTGLSDDYQYTLDAAATEATNDAAPADAGSDAPSSKDGSGGARDAGRVCTANQTASAETTIDDASGANLSPNCRTCLASKCCSEVSTCGGNSTCQSSMACVFTCQSKQNAKTQCLNNCKPGFTPVVGTCVQQECASQCQLN